MAVLLWYRHFLIHELVLCLKLNIHMMNADIHKGAVKSYVQIGLQTSEVSLQWRRLPDPSPDASYSCISCCPTGFWQHAAVWRRPALRQSCRPGKFQRPVCGTGSLGSAAQSHYWYGKTIKYISMRASSTLLSHRR